MAPTPSSAQTAQIQQDAPAIDEASLAKDGREQVPKPIFIDLMMGNPLQIFVEKDVDDRDSIVQRVQQHGGTVTNSYSGAPYILVDPHKESGQNLYRQYAGKKGKLVLDARWVLECIQAGSVQTFANDFAGCKVTGTELLPIAAPTVAPSDVEIPNTQNKTKSQPSSVGMGIAQHIAPTPDGGPLNIEKERANTPSHQSVPPSSDPMGPVPNPFHYDQTIYPPHVHLASRSLHLPPGGPSQSWHPPGGILPPRLTASVSPQPPLPPQRSIPGQPPAPYRQDVWATYYPHPYPTILGGSSHPAYDHRYRDEQTGWIAADYPEQHYGSYPPPSESFLGPPPGEPSAVNCTQPASAGPSTPLEKPRGRKRMRTATHPAPPTSSLVVSKRNPSARSPTPPARVVKSTYGGNLFTPEDIEYLRKYIAYCQEQGLVLSLREICERVAVKAPHHSFYSWRRYCNKHQIRLGGYAMARDRSNSPSGAENHGPESEINILEEGESVAPVQQDSVPDLPERTRELAEALATGDLSALEKHFSANPPSTSRLPITPSMVDTPLPSSSTLSNLPPPPTIAPFVADIGVPTSNGPLTPRNRSPTPPRALFRSTTGKGVAFTPEDVTFLVKFLEYRQSQGKLDMVLFWKEVAAKAPHHSRASWMKYYRRHKHELHHAEGDEPLPIAPEKKLRYSSTDDILLAKFFYQKPEGTSDKLFQNFARQHPHHPWKGWQEHYRIHKTQIDHLMQRLDKGEVIDELPIIEANEQPEV